jgi:hypothetical protein
VRAVAIDATVRSTGGDEIDSAAALTLAESLGVPLITKDPDLTSARVDILRC